MIARAPRPGEAPALRAMVHGALGGTPYAAVAAGWLDDALAGRGTELRALVLAGADGAPAALALFGLTAGAEGAGRVHLLLAGSHSPLRGGEPVVQRRGGPEARGDRPVAPARPDAPEPAAAAVTAALVHAVTAALAALGARFALAEIPGDAPFAPMRAALQAHGFTREGEVADFYCDGVPLVLLRREIMPR